MCRPSCRRSTRNWRGRALPSSGKPPRRLEGERTLTAFRTPPLEVVRSGAYRLNLLCRVISNFLIRALLLWLLRHFRFGSFATKSNEQRVQRFLLSYRKRKEI